MQRVDLPQGQLELARHPDTATELQAWDAADELLLAHVADEGVDLGGSVAILNDTWGALATALADHAPDVISDSYVSHLAIAANLEHNGRAELGVRLLGSFDPAPATIDVLLVRVPKSLALLEDQLRRLAGALHPATVVIGASMTRHLHTSTLDLFERIVGPTRTSLAERKARLVFAVPDPALDPGPNPWPSSFLVPPDGLAVSSHAGVFSSEHLDIGTRVLLAHLSGTPDARAVVDLGCGNGVLGTRYAQAHPDAHVRFVDESFRAVASAELTFRAALGPDRSAEFIVGDGIANPSTGDPPPPGSIDLVLNNPPFHRDHGVGDATAWQMFREAHAALRPGGELWVVGNRHLGYHAKLRRLFGAADVVASNPKFVVLRARRS